MEQKLQRLLHSVSPRAAWITVAGCVCFWLVSLTGVLTPPLGTPAYLTLFWFYAMLMLALASGIAAVGAAAALLVRGRGEPAAGPSAGAVPNGPEQESADDADDAAEAESADDEDDQDDQDQLAGLGRILDNPGRDRH